MAFSGLSKNFLRTFSELSKKFLRTFSALSHNFSETVEIGPNCLDLVITFELTKKVIYELFFILNVSWWGMICKQFGLLALPF